MNKEYEIFRDRVFSAMHGLAKENEIYADAQMLLGSAETDAALFRQNILKTIETDWIDEIERVIPHLDTVIRNPWVAIEDVEEVLPVEVSRHINDRSVKHLSQHTNLILDIKGDEVVPQKILNVYRDETYLTYENKFVNTLLARLSAFVDKRYRALSGGRGTERIYKLDYSAGFEHHPSTDGGRNSAQIHLTIELTSPLDSEVSESTVDINEKYVQALERIDRINRAITSYRSSTFAEKLGRAYIRPPVIRTNAILKNKDMKECLKLWEFIESYEKVGYSIQADVEARLPEDAYVRDLYSTVALQYVNFYNGVAESDANRLLSKKHIFDQDPEFAGNPPEEDYDDYEIYDTDYRKKTPVSRLIANPPKLSRDEKKIATAITVALEADALLTARRLAEEEARRLAEEEARRRIAEEERLRREAEEKEAAAAEARRLAIEEAKRRTEEREQYIRSEAERLEREALNRLKAEEERAYMIERARLYALAQAAKQRATWKYAPEDDNYEGCHPICPYKWSEYSMFSRKKKKQIKLNMDKVARYSGLQKEIAKLQTLENSQIAQAQIREFTEICGEIVSELPKTEGWIEILQYHVRADKHSA